VDLSPRNRFATLRALRDARQARRATTTAFVRMHLEGANPEAQIVGTDQLPGKVNYFFGNDPKKWHTDVPSFARVKYVGIYPGVDLVFYGTQRRLEYDFVVAPGADPNVIALKLEGIRNMRVNTHGDLLLSVPGGQVELQKPVIYQQVKGERHEISGKYTLAKDHRVTFSVANYDRTEPLVLDPVLNYSTYLGGTSDDMGSAIAVDANGNAFVAGTTFSTDFPTPAGVNGFQHGPVPANVSPNSAAFVSELNPAGSALLYSTYIAGTAAPGEFAFGIAVDSSGKIYLTGLTFSTDFPTNSTVPGFKLTSSGAASGTSFITKLDPAQNGTASLLYSSYLGGTGGVTSDVGQSVAVADASGVVYVTGLTGSTAGTGSANFPVVNGFQTALSGTSGNAFLTKIDTTTSAAPVFSTYLGGNGIHSASGPGYGDAGFGVTVDSSGNAYLVGTTSSTDLITAHTPTITGFSTSNYPTGNTTNTAFVARIDTVGKTLAYLTYLGGAGPDFGDAIALGPAPKFLAYVTGQTNSSAFPIFPVPGAGVTGPYQTTKGAAGVVFVSLIDTTSNANPSYSTFLGGTGGEEGLGIRVDGQGNAYVGGRTSSTDFPVTQGALQQAKAAVAPSNVNGFLSEVNPGGNGKADLLYSSYFGGKGDGVAADVEQVEALALDSTNNVYLTGHTFSTAASFYVLNPIAGGGALKPPGDAFVTKLTLIPTMAVSPASLAFGPQPLGVTTTAKTVTLTNNTGNPIPFSGGSITFTGTSSADFASPSNTCGASIAAGAPCTVNVTFTPSTSAAPESAALVITVTVTNGGVSSSQAFTVSLTGTVPAVGLMPTSLAFGNQGLNTTSTAMTVTLTNTGSGALTINSISIPAPSDFAETSTGATACPITPGTLAAGANCTISVTFTPTALGARAGTLTITDNAAGSPHTVQLTGTGTAAPDFALAVTPASQTVKNGAPSTYTVTITPSGGFNSAVALTCMEPTTLTLSTCTAMPSSITPPVVTSTLTVTSTAMLLPLPKVPTPPASWRQIVPLVLALTLLFLLFTPRRLRTRLGMATAILFLIGLAGCSGASKPHTTKGTYTLTVTGTSGALIHSKTVTLTLN